MNLDHLLLLGSRGADVSALQRTLNDLGQTGRITADGRFGLRTQAAVKAFQQRHHLMADGVVGPKTAKALGWTFLGGSPPPPVLVSLKKPPLPAATPPLLVVYEAIQAGLTHLFSKLKDCVAQSGASGPVIVQSAFKLQRLLQMQCDQVKGVLSKETPDSLSIFALMGVGFEGKGVIKEIQSEIAQSGGNPNKFFLLEHSRHALLMQLGPIVQDLMYGNETAMATIAKIRNTFVREYGTY